MCDAAVQAGFVGHRLHWYTLFSVVSNHFLSAILLLFASLPKLSLERQPRWLKQAACCGTVLQIQLALFTLEKMQGVAV